MTDHLLSKGASHTGWGPLSAAERSAPGAVLPKHRQLIFPAFFFKSSPVRLTIGPGIETGFGMCFSFSSPPFTQLFFFHPNWEIFKSYTVI